MTTKFTIIGNSFNDAYAELKGLAMVHDVNDARVRYRCRLLVGEDTIVRGKSSLDFYQALDSVLMRADVTADNIPPGHLEVQMTGFYR
jgi:hypothetical protein